MYFINRILDKCVRSGAEMAEIYQLKQRNLFVSVRDGKVETVAKAAPGGIAIRYISFGKTAFAHTTDISDTAIDSMISRLSRLVKKTSKDEFTGLPSTQNYEHQPDIYNPEFIDISTDYKIEYLAKLEQLTLQYDTLITKANVSYDETLATHSIVNTNGAAMSYDSTLYTVSVMATALKKDEMFPGEGEFSARYFNDLPGPEEIANQVASKAVRLIGGSVVESGDYEIIFTPGAVPSFLWGLFFALKGDNYLKGASFLAGKIGRKIAVDKFNLYDNPLLPRGIDSRPADDEGVASKKLALIENGILNEVLYDTKTAAKAGVESTSSANRRDYSGFPEISASNFYIGKGNDNFDDVVASCKKGIIVEQTQGWGINGITGQYSAGINGTLVRNGRIIKPVANVALAASVDELFNRIEAICDDITFYDNFNMPSIMVQKMKVGA